MFTGLVEEIGVVAELDANDATGGTSLTIELPAASTLLRDAQLGDSIAVNGVCLTATELLRGAAAAAAAANGGDPAPAFRVGVAPETLRRTNLGALRPGAAVNLERAVRADTRLGGHFVQGHVDGVATVTAVRRDGNALTFRFAARDRARQHELLRYVVFKGYVALDGTSLTVTAVDDDEGWWEVMLVAYTQEKVVLARKREGDTVNVEVDVLAKYAEKSMAGYMSARGDGLVAPVIEKMVQDMVAQAMGGHST
ncbi:Lumazine-binding protein [Xylariomycetidae sp. FL0641]|nr:Lumazine-binding protein [Xylariomycetidae sp. FL0641]